MDTAFFANYERLSTHRIMLRDRVRTEAFRRAIEDAVRPGDVVVDLGAGTGILSVFASRAGARTVYAIERTGVVNLARRVVADADAGNVTFLVADSAEVEIDEPCDVLVSECIGFFGIQENMVTDVLELRGRVLRAGGRVVPRAIELHVAPVEAPGAYQDVSIWDSASADYGVDLRAVRELAVNTSYQPLLQVDQLLGPAQHLATIDLEHDEQVVLDHTAQLPIERAGTMHGIGGSFVAPLSDAVTLDASFGRETHWRHEFFPCRTPVPVEPGDVIGVRIEGAARQGTGRLGLGASPQRHAGRSARSARERTDRRRRQLAGMTSPQLAGMTSRHPAPTLPGMFAAVARRSGANVAIVQDGREVTYAQLDAWARSAAHHLVEAGVAPGDVVAVEWRRSPESVAAVIGVLAAGAAFLPLRDTDPPGRRRAVLDDAGVAPS